MPNITINDMILINQENESVLDTLLRENILVPHACQQGVCQSCLMRSIDTPPPVYAQVGLKNTLQKQQYFLACMCHPIKDMTVSLPNYQTDLFNATVIEKQLLATDIMRVVLEYETEFEFFAGQFVDLHREDGLARSYSIANRSQGDNRLEFHIRRLPNGQFSSWVHDELLIGSNLKLSEAKGSCYYLANKKQNPLLLIGTGCGLAPLMGIIEDALAQGHKEDIYLFHGSRYAEGLYLVNEMHELTKQYANFHYTPCLSGQNDADYAQGRVHDVALARIENLKGWRVYLCGHPEMVNQSKRMAYLKGASLSDIYADAFYAISETH
ncbi:CDP-4-dehydro-6-deoxyglucose reductase, E3 [Patescibacteria group bacterium]|nr:CDP-4-dehydro-6-deoxyglucose reductase, E3 [Patescibacteria group bacterium]